MIVVLGGQRQADPYDTLWQTNLTYLTDSWPVRNPVSKTAKQNKVNQFLFKQKKQADGT